VASSVHWVTRILEPSLKNLYSAQVLQQLIFNHVTQVHPPPRDLPSKMDGINPVEDESKESTSRKLKVLVIQKGFGSGSKATAKYKILDRHFKILMPTVPEPAYSMAGIPILERAIEEFSPDVLVASSRGGKYAGRLVKSGKWKGPLLLISAMSVCLSRNFLCGES